MAATWAENKHTHLRVIPREGMTFLRKRTPKLKVLKIPYALKEREGREISKRLTKREKEKNE